MFYEEIEIIKSTSCCKCGDTVCSRCVASIHVNSGQFDCIECDKKHAMPQQGFLVNKTVLILLAKQPSEVYRSRAVEHLKEKLNEIQQKMTLLLYGINNSIDKIKEQCINLRSDVQLAAEQAVEQINESSQELINHIKSYQPV